MSFGCFGQVVTAPCKLYQLEKLIGKASEQTKVGKGLGPGKPTGDLALYVSNLTARTVMDIHPASRGVAAHTAYFFGP